MPTPFDSLPRVALVTTGGTIAGLAPTATQTAGYRAGELDASQLLAAVPGLEQLAAIDSVAPLAIDSKDITTGQWLALARCVEAQRMRPEIDAVVITHGTDTLEESAYFLNLVLAPGKPVVLTAAMRPAGALSADGPLNLYQAVKVAASGVTHGLGVCVVIHQQIWSARDLRKTRTHTLDAFAAPNTGPLGIAEPPALLSHPLDDGAGLVPLARLDGRIELPLVEVLYVAGGSQPVFLPALAALGVCGVVLALPGNGSLPAHWEAAVAALPDQGIAVVLASRTGGGPVSATASLRFGQPAGWLSPPQARIALMLALAVGEPSVFSTLSRLPA
jgi:L-asparaginase